MKARPPAGQNLYESIGGAERLRALVRRFFDEVDALPADQTLRVLLGPDTRRHEQRMLEFLSGWLGGPPLYMRRHGHPNLRERHRHVPIGSAERDQWLLCMRRALAAEIADGEVRERLETAFWNIANSLRNRDEPSATALHTPAAPGSIGQGTAHAPARSPPARRPQ